MQVRCLDTLPVTAYQMLTVQMHAFHVLVWIVVLKLQKLRTLIL